MRFQKIMTKNLGRGQQIQDEELGDGATTLRQRSWGMAKKFRTKNLGWKQINGSTAGFLDCKKVELRKVRGAKQLIMTAA